VVPSPRPHEEIPGWTAPRRHGPTCRPSYPFRSQGHITGLHAWTKPAAAHIGLPSRPCVILLGGHGVSGLPSTRAGHPQRDRENSRSQWVWDSGQAEFHGLWSPPFAVQENRSNRVKIFSVVGKEVGWYFCLDHTRSHYFLISFIIINYVYRLVTN